MNAPWELLDAHFEGEITPEQAAELSAWLGANREHTRLLVREAHLRGCLRAELASALFEGEKAAIVQFPNPATNDRRRFLFSRQLIAAAASVALLLSVAFWYFGPAMGKPVLAEANGTDISVERGTHVITATGGMLLHPGDLLRVGTNASAALAFGKERTTIILQSRTEFTLTSFASSKRFHLRAGTLEASVSRQRPFAPLIITTPNAIARVIGTRFTLTANANRTTLAVEEGRVRLTDSVTGANFAVRTGAAIDLPAVLSAGHLLREYWTNSTGNFTQSIQLNPSLGTRPDGWDYLERFQSKPLKAGQRFGERIRGYVHPPVTGLYRFAVSVVQAEAALHLSRSDKLEDVVQVAWKHPDGPGPDLDKVTPVPLQAGRKYYIEILHESHGGDDQLTVMWQAPGRDPEIIPGEFLSPFPSPEKKGKK